MDLEALLQKLRRLDGDTVSLGDVVEEIADRGYGPLLLVPALIVLLPSGAVPGVPSICGILIALIAVQLVFGRRCPWLPRRLGEFTFSGAGFSRAVDRLLPIAARIDRFIHPRLGFLTEWPFSRILAGVCAVLGLSMIPLEVIPFAAAGPAAAVFFAALALSVRDGLLAIVSTVILAIFIALMFVF